MVDGVYAPPSEQIDRFLEINIADDRKRLAFRLFMDELPFKSTRSNSIAKALGIDESTARQWIKEMQVQLVADWRSGMTDRSPTPDRDEVLFAFQEACPRPTAQQLIDWTGRYPQFAEDIRAHRGRSEGLGCPSQISRRGAG